MANEAIVARVELMSGPGALEEAIAAAVSEYERHRDLARDIAAFAEAVEAGLSILTPEQIAVLEAEHSPGKQHNADNVAPFDVGGALAKAGAK